MIPKNTIINHLLPVAFLIVIFPLGCSTTAQKPTLTPTKAVRTSTTPAPTRTVKTLPARTPTRAVKTSPSFMPIRPGTGLAEITNSNQIPKFKDNYGRIELLYAVDNSREYFKKVERYPDIFKSIGFTPKKQIETLNLFRDGYVSSKSPQALTEFITKNFRVFQAAGKANGGAVQFAGYGLDVRGQDVKRKWDHTVYNTSIGFPATQMRSIATGEGLFPPGGLAFAVIETGEHAGKSFFVLGHDTKSAIKTAARADIFFGIGKDALRKAGNFHTSGKLYYLLKR